MQRLLLCMWYKVPPLAWVAQATFSSLQQAGVMHAPSAWHISHSHRRCCVGSS